MASYGQFFVYNNTVTIGGKMGKLQPGTVIPVRNAFNPIVPDKEFEPPPHYLEYAITRVARNLDRILRLISDQTKLVEEYAGESIEGATGEVTLSVVADYSPASERITSILVTGPVTTAFTLQLGDRYMTLSTDATGKCLLAPVSMTLKPSSQRLLTSATNGSWFLQLSGYALTGKVGN